MPEARPITLRLLPSAQIHSNLRNRLKPAIFALFLSLPVSILNPTSRAVLDSETQMKLFSRAADPQFSSARRLAKLAGPAAFALESLECRLALSASDLISQLLDIEPGNGSVFDEQNQNTPAPALVATPAAPEADPQAGLRVAPSPQVEISENPTIPTSDFRYTLIPGNGFTAPTDQPDPVGNPADFGYDAKAIARWDVVPFQTFDDKFEIGVVAFHISGIDRVDFSVNGGDWTSVKNMTYNKRTGVTEYTVTLDAKNFPDGPIEVRAIAWPNVGEPRVLAGPMDTDVANRAGEHSLILYTNANGTSPEQVIELQAGDYTWGHTPFAGSQSDPNRWIVYRPAPGVAREEVRIVDTVFVQPPPGHPSIQMTRIKFENITVDATVRNDGQDLLRYVAGRTFWYDRVVFQGRGQFVTGGQGYSTTGYMTDSIVRDTQHTPGVRFVRGCTYERIGEKAMRGVSLVINTTVNYLDRGPNHVEPGAWHHSGISNPVGGDNRVYYGLNMYDVYGETWAFRQGTSDLSEHRDVAVVNCRSIRTYPQREDPGFEGYTMMLGGHAVHLLIKDSDFNGPFIYRTGASNPVWNFTSTYTVWDNVTWNGAPFSNTGGFDNVLIR